MGGLPDYLGRPVVATSARIINTGDGLSKAMNMDPELYEPGNDAVILLRGKWSEHGHKYDQDTGAYSLKQTVVAGTIVILPPEAVPGVEHYLDEMESKIELHRDLAEGIHKLPSDEALTAEHEAGAHAQELNPACPECRLEMDIAEREATGEVVSLPSPPKAGRGKR